LAGTNIAYNAKIAIEQVFGLKRDYFTHRQTSTLEIYASKKDRNDAVFRTKKAK